MFVTTKYTGKSFQYAVMYVKSDIVPCSLACLASASAQSQQIAAAVTVCLLMLSYKLQATNNTTSKKIFSFYFLEFILYIYFNISSASTICIDVKFIYNTQHFYILLTFLFVNWYLELCFVIIPHNAVFIITESQQ